MVSALLSVVTWTGNRLEAKTENQADFSPWNKYQKNMLTEKQPWIALSCLISFLHVDENLPAWCPLQVWEVLASANDSSQCLYKIGIWVSRREDPQHHHPVSKHCQCHIYCQPSSGKSSKRGLCSHLIPKNKLSGVIQCKRWWKSGLVLLLLSLYISHTQCSFNSTWFQLLSSYAMPVEQFQQALITFAGRANKVREGIDLCKHC